VASQVENAERGSEKPSTTRGVAVAVARIAIAIAIPVTAWVTVAVARIAIAVAIPVTARVAVAIAVAIAIAIAIAITVAVPVAIPIPGFPLAPIVLGRWSGVGEARLYGIVVPVGLAGHRATAEDQPDRESRRDQARRHRGHVGRALRTDFAIGEDTFTSDASGHGPMLP
jgi:hypothetical protein